VNDYILRLTIFQNRRLRVGDREARANCQRRELVGRIAAGEPVRKLFFVEALGHARVPFAGYRSDHRAGVELAAIDAHRAAKATADVEGRFDDRVASEAWRHRLEIGDFPGRAAAGDTDPPRWVRCGDPQPMRDETVLSACLCRCGPAILSRIV
jgi:hypothetical protein